ncbi:MAG TPA: TolC family protein [Vicinamibacterales bacterium]|jgi:cobalt-zinc-cadmium efflux system outer membrane protein
MTRVARLVWWLALPFAVPITLDGQGPLTYEAALDMATSRNLRVEAARRQRAVRESAVRTAGLLPNPDLVAETSRDIPHQALSLDFPLEIGGQRSRRLDLAREELSLAESDVQVELRSLRREVREAFYSLIAANERVRLAESAVEIAQRVRDIAQARFDAGAVPRLEVLQADLGVARAATDLDLVRSLQAAFRATLNGVINLPPDQPTDVAGSLSDHTAASPTYEEARRIARASNVDLVALDRQAAVERRRVELLRAERVPTPVFSFGALWNAPGEFTVGPRFGVTMGVPLFSRNQGEIAGSVAVTSQLRAQRDATERTIENALFGTVGRIQAQRQRATAYTQRLVPTAVDLESLAEESYKAGRTPVLSLIDAQRTVRDVRDEAVQAALDVQISIAELEELLGTTVQ